MDYPSAPRFIEQSGASERVVAVLVRQQYLYPGLTIVNDYVEEEAMRTSIAPTRILLA